MSSNGVKIKLCQVVSVLDTTDGDRIKVRLSPTDNRKSDAELPYVLPLLPKMLHIKPKVGEWVVVFIMTDNEGVKTRHYVGPIISQPHKMEEETSLLDALSLFPGAHKDPEIAPSTKEGSHGAFAKDDEIAIYGRKKADIIMSDDDVRIRSGARVKDASDKNNIVYNANDSAFIQLKHTDENRGTEKWPYRSTATIVADNINLIGNNSKEPFKPDSRDQIYSDEKMQEIINKAHQLPYGDVLVDFLKLFADAFFEHQHPYPGMEPIGRNNFVKLKEYNYNNLLSQSVRIN